MSELRYPNESKEYREARVGLLKEEQELVDKVKSVAEKRRKLPPGGQLLQFRATFCRQQAPKWCLPRRPSELGKQS